MFTEIDGKVILTTLLLEFSKDIELKRNLFAIVALKQFHETKENAILGLIDLLLLIHKHVAVYCYRK